MRKINTCLNCSARQLGCHAMCEKYNSAKKALSESQLLKRDLLEEFKIEQILRAKKRRRRW